VTRFVSPFLRRSGLTALAAALLIVVLGVWITIANGDAYRRQQLTQLQVQADISARSLAAALAFDDRETMANFTDALSANPDISMGAVYDVRGERVAGFSRSPSEALPPMMPAEGDNEAAVSTPVIENGRMLGSVYLRANIEPFFARVFRYSSIALFALLAALVAALAGASQHAMARANAELAKQAQNLSEEMQRREKAERAFMQSQRMEAVGQLTGGLAHDFNNLLAAIGGGLLLLFRTDDPARRATIRDSMKQALDRGAKLTRQLLTFARGHSLDPVVLNPGNRLGNFQDLLRGSLREDIDLEISAASDVWNIEVDATQLELCLLNLAVNARDAMPRGGMLKIEAYNVQRDESPPGDFVRIVVSDTGQGMPDHVLDRAFEPFFTTKDVGKGSGLGLAQVYGFARQSRGVCWIQSRPDEGAQVFIDLPRSRRSAVNETAPEATGFAQTPLQRAPVNVNVLLVEDDDAVAAVVRDLMRISGFNVRRASTAGEAIDLLGGEKFDVVFSDIVMPGGMNGVELAREIRRRFPALPVLLTTGFSGNADMTPGEFRIFHKPYDPARMLAEIRNAVAR
jgi:signal transduction histidine kinase